MNVDVAREPLGVDQKGKKVFLKDIWPSNKEIGDFVAKNITKQMFTKKYADVFKGDGNWRKISVKGGMTYDWDKKSTYVQNPPYFVRMGRHPKPLEDIVDARVLALLLDSITTDHISPAGSIKVNSPAGKYLVGHKVKPADFNQYGTRRGNHEVMMRGTFANIRIKNQMVPGVEGGVTVHYPSKQRMPIYDAAMKYKSDGVPLVVFRRQGIRQWFFPRLGRQGFGAARDPRGCCPIFRAYPPLEPGGHGRDATGLRRGDLLADPRPKGR